MKTRNEIEARSGDFPSFDPALVLHLRRSTQTTFRLLPGTGQSYCGGRAASNICADGFSRWVITWGHQKPPCLPAGTITSARMLHAGRHPCARVDSCPMAIFLSCNIFFFQRAAKRKVTRIHFGVVTESGAVALDPKSVASLQNHSTSSIFGCARHISRSGLHSHVFMALHEFSGQR